MGVESECFCNSAILWNSPEQIEGNTPIRAWLVLLALKKVRGCYIYHPVAYAARKSALKTGLLDQAASLEISDAALARVSSGTPLSRNFSMSSATAEPSSCSRSSRRPAPT